MAAALDHLKSEEEFRRFPAQRFVNFDLIRPSYISICPPPTKVFRNGAKIWRLAQSEADKLRGEPLSIRYPDIERRLAAHPFLKGMSRHHLELLALCAMPTEFDAGQIIFLEGDPANGFYLIETGTVVLEGKTSEGSRSLSILFRLANRWDGRGFSRPISGILMREPLRHAPQFVFPG